MTTYPEPRTIRAGGWCCRCLTPDVPTTTGGHGGNVCRQCATDAADVALFEQAERATVVEDPEQPGKPMCEWVADVDNFGPRVGFLGIHADDGLSVYRVEESGDCLGSRVATLIRLPSKKQPRTTAYTVRATASGLGECECAGFTRWQRCKHVRCVSALIRERLI